MTHEERSTRREQLPDINGAVWNYLLAFSSLDTPVV